MKKWLLSLCAVGVVSLSHAGIQILAETAHLILPDDAPRGTIVFRAEIKGKPMRRANWRAAVPRWSVLLLIRRRTRNGWIAWSP
jgi:hypothetical protein